MIPTTQNFQELSQFILEQNSSQKKGTTYCSTLLFE